MVSAGADKLTGIGLVREIQSLVSAVEFPIYLFYDMDLVDLIIFTVGDP